MVPQPQGDKRKLDTRRSMAPLLHPAKLRSCRAVARPSARCILHQRTSSCLVDTLYISNSTVAECAPIGMGLTPASCKGNSITVPVRLGYCLSVCRLTATISKSGDDNAILQCQRCHISLQYHKRQQRVHITWYVRRMTSTHLMCGPCSRYGSSVARLVTTSCLKRCDAHGRYSTS